jgi:hypothetical protein
MEASTGSAATWAGPTAAPTATELTSSEAIAAIRVDMIFD